MNLKKFISISISIAVLLAIVCLFGCSRFLHFREKSKFELSVNECSGITCINEIDSNIQRDLRKEGKRMLQIYLIRHAKPNLKKKLFYSAQEAQQYVRDYNSVPVVPIDKSLVKVNLNANHIIYCSNLPRSQETALRIFADQFPIVSDSIFREYEIRMINANSIIKLPLVIWQAFSRGSWMLGYNHNGIESRKEAKLRASMAAENLIKVAKLEETAVLVAHGMLNGGIEKELKKRGWKLIQKKGHLNLGATVLVKIIDL
ncbi:histidine phosphatase family protein [Marinifilum sp. RC60d5]|uniref:histidine phosphatase family protein n=1 Tax=Marinifilum sp. RC60d5 TaxID=3458414 RepID=UPI0040372CDC